MFGNIFLPFLLPSSPFFCTLNFVTSLSSTRDPAGPPWQTSIAPYIQFLTYSTVLAVQCASSSRQKSPGRPASGSKGAEITGTAQLSQPCIVSGDRQLAGSTSHSPSRIISQDDIRSAWDASSGLCSSLGTLGWPELAGSSLRKSAQEQSSHMGPTTSDCCCYDALCDWKEPRVSAWCFQQPMDSAAWEQLEDAALPGVREADNTARVFYPGSAHIVTFDHC